MPSTKRLAPCLIIAGPTASGKSWLADELAETLDGVIINADSMQVYKGLKVITAQPDLDERHRLYSVFTPQDICSAARWRELAVAEINAAYDRGKQPIVVGGTGLYLKTLMEGLSCIPEIPHEIRTKARHMWDERGAHAFHKELKAVDHKSANTLNLHDKQRSIRAYEVKIATGKSIIDWQSEATSTNPEFHFHKILILPPKPILVERIAQRFTVMLHEGALIEVQTLNLLSKDYPAKKAIGVPELLDYLHGNSTLEQAIERVVIASRQLAKRQSTWFRNQFEADVVLQHVPDIQDVNRISEAF